MLTVLRLPAWLKNRLKIFMEQQSTAKAFQSLSEPTIWQKVTALCEETKGISLVLYLFIQSQGTPSFGYSHSL